MWLPQTYWSFSLRTFQPLPSGLAGPAACKTLPNIVPSFRFTLAVCTLYRRTLRVVLLAARHKNVVKGCVNFVLDAEGLITAGCLLNLQISPLNKRLPLFRRLEERKNILLSSSPQNVRAGISGFFWPCELIWSVAISTLAAWGYRVFITLTVIKYYYMAFMQEVTVFTLHNTETQLLPLDRTQAMGKLTKCNTC